MYKSNWKNILVEPDQINDVTYGGNGVLNLAADGRMHKLGGFAGQKLLRMTKSYKSKLDDIETKRAHEAEILLSLQSRKDPLILRLWEPTDQYLSVVGTDYVPLDSQELGDVALKVSHEMDVTKASLTYQPLHYARGHDRTTVIFEEKRVIAIGDFVRSGLQIFNNELGARSMRVQSFVERLICTNGATSRKFGFEFTKIHLGNKDKIIETFQDSIKEIINNRWKLAEIMKATMAVRLTVEEMQEVVAHHQQDGLISLKTATGLVKILQSGQYGSESKTLYGLVNAYTGLATHGGNWTVRDQLESIIETRLLSAANKDQLLG